MNGSTIQPNYMGRYYAEGYFNGRRYYKKKNSNHYLLWIKPEGEPDQFYINSPHLNSWGVRDGKPTTDSHRNTSIKIRKIKYPYSNGSGQSYRNDIRNFVNDTGIIVHFASSNNLADTFGDT